MSENPNINLNNANLNNANLNNANLNINNAANNINNEVEAHGRFNVRPVEINANALNVVVVNEASGPETEAHRFMPGAGDPENESRASFALTFPADAPPQRFEIHYTPPVRPGDEPEVVLHMLPNV